MGRNDRNESFYVTILPRGTPKQLLQGCGCGVLAIFALLAVIVGFFVITALASHHSSTNGGLPSIRPNVLSGR